MPLTIVSADGQWYHLGANDLVAGLGFVNPIGYLMGGLTVPGANHPPGWTAVLAFGSWVGWRTWFAHQVLACCVGTATIPVIGLAGRRLAGARAGLIAAALAAIYPNFWLYDSQLLSETPVILGAATTILVALWFCDAPNLRRAIALGACSGLLGLVRAEQILLVGVLVVPVAIFAGHGALRQRLTWTCAGVAASVLVIAPWVGYNLSRFDEPTYLTTNFGQALAQANCHETYRGRRTGFWSPRCGGAAAKTIGVTFDFTLSRQLAARHMDDSTLDAASRRVGLDYMEHHVTELPRVVVAREGRTWNVFHPFQQMHLDLVRGDVGYLFAGLFAYWLLAALAVYGVVVLRRRTLQLVVLASFIVTVVIATAITFGQTRYRAPADVSIVLLAAVAVDARIGRIRGARDTRPAGYECPDRGPATAAPSAAGI